MYRVVAKTADMLAEDVFPELGQRMQQEVPGRCIVGKAIVDVCLKPVPQ